MNIEDGLTPNNILDLMVHVQFQRVHGQIEMDLLKKYTINIYTQRKPSKKKTNLIQEMHQQHLRVTFTMISRPCTLSRFSHLDNDEIQNDVARTFIQPRIHRFIRNK